MARTIRHSALLAISAVALVAAGLSAAALPTRAAEAVVPVVSNFTASTTSLPQSGGSISLSAELASSATCKLSASPKIDGLVATPSCTSASMSQDVDIPANLKKTPVAYTFKLKAKNAAGKAAGSISVTVAALDAPSISNLAASESTLTPAGGTIELTADVTGAANCSIKVSPKLPGFPAVAPCIEGQLTQQVEVPANTKKGPVVYAFKVKAKNSAGTATSRVSVTVASLSAPSIGPLSVTPSSVSSAGGVVHLQGLVTGDPSCTVKVTPAVAGSPFTANCASGTIDQPITLPANVRLSPVTYKIKVKVVNSVGSAKGSTSTSVLAGSAPTITTFTASSSSLSAAGGQVTLSGSLSGATSCSITVRPSIAGAPWSPSCSDGALSQVITLPANATTKAIKYSFKLAVASVSGKAKATAQVVVAQSAPPTVTTFTSSPSPSSILGGLVTLSGTVTSATACSISVSPAIAGAPYQPACSSGSLTQQVQLPTNLGIQPVTYTFSLTATGLGGSSRASTVKVVVPAAFPALSFIVPQVLITPQGYPAAISCPTTTFCAAVDLSGAALIRANGTWSAPMAIDGSQLTAISCTSAAFCEAVDSGGNVVTYDGTTWSAPSSIRSVGLTSIACVSTSNCRAASVDGSILAWDGNSWSAGQSVSPYSINSVSCVLPTLCMAVDAAGQAFSFNGSAWSAATTVSQDALSSVSCASTTTCVAVGVTSNGSNVFQWNGTSWSAAANLGGSYGGGIQLVSVACPSPSTCSAVDDHGNAYVSSSGAWSTGKALDATGMMAAVSCGSATQCVALSFGGYSFTWAGPGPSSWAPDGRVDVPAGQLTAISCGSPSSCVAVSSDGRAFVRTGGGWSAPSSTGLSSPTGVSCSSSTFCMAVSLDGTAAAFDGNVWTATAVVPTAPPLDAVSCTSPTHCLAVSAGGDFTSFNGSTWSSPVTTASQTAAINSVSCVTSTFCAAVSQNGTVWFWNGTGLSSSKVVFAGSVPGTSIACTKTTYCVAGSRDGRVATWTGGATWATATVSDHSIAGVTCIPGTSACLALDSIGRATTSVGPGTWTALVTAETTGAGLGASCTSDGACTVIDGASATRSS